MNPIAYCTHPETEIISLAVKIGNDSSFVIVGESEVKAWCRGMDWSDKIVIAHNMSGFDAMILKWRCGIKPAMWGCTLAMAKPHHAMTVGGSLAKLVAHYQLGVKDQTVLNQTKGRHLCDFTPQEVEDMKKYNRADTDQCSALFDKLLPLTPKQEMKLIDMTIRMLVEPKFRVDNRLLFQTLGEERVRKKASLEKLAHDMGWEPDMETQADEFVRASLASAPRYAAFLQQKGVEVPMKQSPTNPEKQTPALAKTDEGLLALLEHDDPVIAASAAARLDVKSTILESRIESFLEVSQATGGRMPIAKNYYGAHTGRWSGAFSLNQENLPRVSNKPSDTLRKCLTAPPGHKVVVADLSGIELRVNMFLWKVPYAMALFQADPEKADLYKTLASEVLGVPIEGMPKMVRQSGKAMHLGCGYGLGSAAKYIAVAKSMAQIDVTEEEAKAHIAGYRRKHPEIVQGWKTCHAALGAIYQGEAATVDPWGLVTTDKEGFVLPTGRKVRYPALRQEVNADNRSEWVFGEGRNKNRIYAGKCDENIVQALARDVLAGNALEIKRRIGLYPAHTVHDELIYIVPASEADEVLAEVQAVMRTPPSWFPQLITWSEGDVADNYGEAK
jgi:hypothetical protein